MKKRCSKIFKFSNFQINTFSNLFIFKFSNQHIFKLIFLFLLASCTTNTSTSKKTIFNINLNEGLSSLDPAFARNQNSLWMVNQVYNGLVQIDDSLKIRPCVAKSWDISPDGKMYTFHLRNDVYFHDDALFENGKGRKAIAADFVYSFYRLIDPKVASSGSWIFSDKVNSKNAFTAVNDTTLQ